MIHGWLTASNDHNTLPHPTGPTLELERADFSLTDVGRVDEILAGGGRGTGGPLNSPVASRLIDNRGASSSMIDATRGRPEGRNRVVASARTLDDREASHF